jgi:hypothetical protein
MARIQRRLDTTPANDGAKASRSATQGALPTRAARVADSGARLRREMRDALDALQVLLRAARRQARRHARAGQLALAARFASHGRLLAAAVAALRLEMASATRTARSPAARAMAA